MATRRGERWPWPTEDRDQQEEVGYDSEEKGRHNQVANHLLAKEWSRFRAACVDGQLVPLDPFEPLEDVDNIDEYIQVGSATFCDVLGPDEYRLAVRNRLQTVLLGKDDNGFVLRPAEVVFGEPYYAVCRFTCTCGGGRWLENSWLVRQDSDTCEPVDDETGETPVMHCKWCNHLVKAWGIKPFDPRKKDDYCAFGRYWPRAHDPSQCPPCIRKKGRCPKKLCHSQPKDYADALEVLFRRDELCTEVCSSLWKESSCQGREVLTKDIMIQFEGKQKSETFEVVLSPQVYCIRRGLPRVLANLRDPNMRRLRNDQCPAFTEGEVWSGSDVLLAFNRAYAKNNERTTDEKTIVFNRVVDQLLDGGVMHEAVHRDVDVSRDGWWWYPLSGPRHEHTMERVAIPPLPSCLTG